jgi:hypothetical protein
MLDANGITCREYLWIVSVDQLQAYSFSNTRVLRASAASRGGTTKHHIPNWM